MFEAPSTTSPLVKAAILALVMVIILSLTAYYVSSTFESLSGKIDDLGGRMSRVEGILANMNETLTEINKKLNISGSTRANTSQQPEVVVERVYNVTFNTYTVNKSIYLKVKAEAIGDNRLKLKVFVTNNSTHMVRNLLLVLITYSPDTGYSTQVKYIDEIEPRVTLRFDYVYENPPSTFYITVITPVAPEEGP